MHRTTTAAAVATLLAATALGLAPHQAQAAPATTVAAAADASSQVRFHDIPGSGGITLKGNVFTPAGAASGRKYPLIVLPTSWGLPQIEYIAQAKKLADSGYVVVSYTSRGFWLSGGDIEVAGPPDIADVSAVIDWALANSPADADRIGLGGVSYAAGITLLASAHDPRVKAVVAMSGWADLIESIYSGRTQHLQAAAMLGAAGYLTGRPGPELKTLLGNFLGSRLDREQEMIEWGRQRSASEQVDRINANGAAIMLGNAWGDTIFPPNQYAKFYERLTGPKRLEFRPGDHATAEGTGLLGLPNDTWTNAHRWFDRYLKGERNGVDTEAPVQIKSRSDDGYEGYADWKSVGAGAPRSSRSPTASTSSPMSTPAPTAASSSCPAPSTSSSRRRRSPPSRSSPGPSRPSGSRSATTGRAGSAAPRSCTPPSPPPRATAPSSRTSTTSARSASASSSATPRTPSTARPPARPSAWTWSCSPPPTTSPRATGSPSSSTPSTRSTSSTTRSARS